MDFCVLSRHVTSLCASSPQSGSLCCGCSLCASPLRHRIPPHGQPASRPPHARSSARTATHQHPDAEPRLRTCCLPCERTGARPRLRESQQLLSGTRCLLPRPSTQPSSGPLVWRTDLFHHHRHHRLHHGVGPGARPAPAVRLPAVRAASPAGGRGVLRPAERRVQRQREGVHR